MEKNVVIFGADMSSFVHVDNKGKDNLIVGEAPTKEFLKPNKRLVLSLHYNGSNSFLLVNATKINQSKAKNSEIKDYAVCLGNFSKNCTIDNLKKTGLKWVVNFFLLILVLLILTVF